MRLFDEINNLSEDEIIDISTYFDDMELSDDEREKRKEFARSMDEIMLFIFALFLTMKDYKYIDRNFIIKQLEIQYLEAVKQFADLDGYIEDYIERFSKDTVDTTIKNGSEDYWTSEERSTLIAVNEANSIMGYQQLQDTIKQGFTRKTWITERDNRVRKTHREVDRETIGITEMFLVGNSLMAYPHDFSAETQEICGCRCSIKYS